MYLQQRSYRRPCCLTVIKRSLEQLNGMIPRNKTRTRTRRTVGAGFNENAETMVKNDNNTFRCGKSETRFFCFETKTDEAAWNLEIFCNLKFFATIVVMVIMIIMIVITIFIVITQSSESWSWWSWSWWSLWSGPSMEVPCQRLNSCNERWEWEAWSKRRPLRIRHSLIHEDEANAMMAIMRMKMMTTAAMMAPKKKTCQPIARESKATRTPSLLVLNAP